jgi:hypothetical protein
MEAEDTVMKKDEIDEVWHFAIETPDQDMNPEWKNEQRKKAIVKRQAEISFAAGKQEVRKAVVEWANEYLGVIGYPPWEAKIKEWGIDSKEGK